MFKRFVIPMLCAALLLPVFETVIAAEHGNTEFYVSPQGDDSNNGSSGAPFKTIEAARDAVRKISSKADGDIVVNILPGEYELEDALYFSEADSGKNGCNIIYRGDRNNRPLISGGSHIGGFELYDEEKNIYRAYAPQFDVIRELYVNGERRYTAKTNTEIQALKKPAEYLVQDYFDKYPNAPVNKYKEYAYYNPDTVYQFDGFYVSKSDLSLVEHPEDLEIFWYHEFKEAVFHVENVEQDPLREDAVIVTLKQNAYDLYLKNSGYMNLPPLDMFSVRNAYELLDMPGEFYFDRREKQLYYIPYDNEDMTTADIIAPRLERLVSLVGNTQEQRIKNITFENLEFAYATWKSPVDTDWVTWQGALSYLYTNTSTEAAVRVFISDNINFYGNVFRSLGASAIDMRNIVDNSDIIGNCFYDIGATTVAIGQQMHRQSFISQIERDELKNNGERLNLLTDEDSTVSASFYGEYDGWNQTRSKDMLQIGTLRNNRNKAYYNGFTNTFIPERLYSGYFTGAWQSDPYAEEKNERQWVRYDMRDKYTIDEIVLMFSSSVSSEQKSEYEVLLSNDRFFEEYYTVAVQQASAGAYAKYRVNTDEKYRFLMIRKLNSKPLALTCAAATTADRPVYSEYARCRAINISNNYMQRISIDYPNATGLFAVMGDDITISHNHIKDVAYSGISVGWNWNAGEDIPYTTNADGMSEFVRKAANNTDYFNNGRNISVHNNYLENTAQYVNDGGAIYTLGGFQSGSAVHDNYSYNSGICLWTYYLDNGSSRVEVYNNVSEDGAEFSSANYDNKSVGVNLHDNYSTHSFTGTIPNSANSIAAHNVFAQGQYSREVYDIKKNAGLQEEYKYLAELPCGGSDNYVDLEAAYIKGDRMNYDMRMIGELVSKTSGKKGVIDVILDNGEFGSCMGQYPYEIYHELIDAKNKIKSASAYTAGDAYWLRDIARRAGKSVWMPVGDELISVCRAAASECEVYEDSKATSADFGKYPRAAADALMLATDRYAAAEDKTDYQAVTALYNAYNDFQKSRVTRDAVYAYIEGMTRVEIDNTAHKATFYFQKGYDMSGLKNVIVYPEPGAGVESVIGDVLLDGTASVRIPVPAVSRTAKAAFYIFAEYDDRNGEEELCAENFTTVSEKEIIQNTGKGILIKPDTNAAVSRYFNKDGRTRFSIRPEFLSDKCEFSILIGLDADKKFYKNSALSGAKYFEVVMNGSSAELYSVYGGKKTKLDSADFAVRSGINYSIAYSIIRGGSSTELSFSLNGHDLFDGSYAIAVDANAWGCQSDKTPLYIGAVNATEYFDNAVSKKSDFGAVDYASLGYINYASLPDVSAEASSYHDAGIACYPINVLFDKTDEYAAWVPKSYAQDSVRELIIDLKRIADVSCVQWYNDTALPDRQGTYNGICLSYSEDGESYQPFYERPDGTFNLSGKVWTDIEFAKPQKLRYIKIGARRPDYNPRALAIRVWGKSESKIGVEEIKPSPDMHGSEPAVINGVRQYHNWSIDEYPLNFYTSARNDKDEAVNLQFDLGAQVKLKAIRFTVNDGYKNSAKNLAVYASKGWESTDCEYFRLANLGELKFGVYNEVEIDYPDTFRYITIAKTDGDKSEGALSIGDVIFVRDTENTDCAGIFARYDGGEIKLTAASSQRHVTVIDKDAADCEVYEAAYLDTSGANADVYPLYGVFDAGDKLIDYGIIEKTSDGEDGALWRREINIKDYERVGAVKMFITAGEEGRIPLVSDSFRAAAKQTFPSTD